MEDKIEVFILFDKEDRDLFLELKQHLAPLVTQGLITIWDEDRIIGGTERRPAIDRHLQSATVILLLVSAHFMASSESYTLARQALTKHAPPEGYVVPVLLHEVDWEYSDFGSLKPLPANRKPIGSWTNRHAAYLDVVKGIREIIAAYKQSLTQHHSSQDISATLDSQEGIHMPDSAQDKKTSFDVFLCHNSKDKDEVKKVAEQLRAYNISPWLDEWELPPGQPWPPLIEEQIKTIPSAAVFVGENDMGPWQKQETYALLQQFVHRGCPVIPVLLGTASGRPDLPPFLGNMTWVDFQKPQPDPLKQLIWGITGRKPDSHANPHSVDHTSPASTSPAPKTLPLSQKIELVNKLLACTYISNRESRETVLGLLNEQFPGIVNRISRRSDNQADVMEIVVTCEKHPGSLQAFCEIVIYFEGNSSINTQELRRFMQQHSL